MPKIPKEVIDQFDVFGGESDHVAFQLSRKKSAIDQKQMLPDIRIVSAHTPRRRFCPGMDSNAKAGLFIFKHSGDDHL